MFKLYYNMCDGPELDALGVFLQQNNIDYDVSGTGDYDYDFVPENDVDIYAKDEYEVALVKAFMDSL